MSSFNSEKIAEIHRELHSKLPSEPALRVKALEGLLVEKGMIKSETIDAWIEHYTEEIGPKRGAHVVARSWLDAAFRDRLMSDAPSALDELGYLGHATGHLKAVENTPTIHNLVVCTLCSCYPFGVLGMAPNWYKTAAYRSRAVRDPRGVLAEFGVRIGDDVEVRVWDSTAELRYLVISERPQGTDGWDEAALTALVSRNSMIGTDRDLTPFVSGWTD
ncbi:MAG: nitrile hydratase subunit alpha [Alphaproteobacteria bacterium]